jgi:pilus assembly protein CpaB
MVLSLGFGLVAAIGINQVMKSNRADAQPVQAMGPVLVAADHMDLNTILTEDNVKIENWPAQIIPPEALTKIEEIAEMSTTVRMSQGMPIVRPNVQHKNQRTVIQIPEGYKVVAIKVSSDQTFSGLLNPGDKVDIIGIFKKRNRRTNQMETVSTTFLKALKVFATGNKLKSGNRGENTTGSTIVSVLVTEKQSEQLVFAQSTGQIKIVLRGDDLKDGEGNTDIKKLIGDHEIGSEAIDEGPVGPANTVTIWSGSESRQHSFDEKGQPYDDGSITIENDYQKRPRRRGSYGPPQGDKARNQGDESKQEDRADSADDNDNDRGIDEDQYRGR